MTEAHTTTQKSWCRPCEAFIPAGVTHEEHEEKVHGVQTSKKPVLKTPKQSAKRKQLTTPPESKQSTTVKKTASAKSSVVFDCKTCGRAFASQPARTKHVNKVHAGRPKPPEHLHCYECNTDVEKDIYIAHLLFHDADRKHKPSEPLATSEVEQDRRYLYLSPNDPRKDMPDAILQCPACPNSLFFSNKTYDAHVNECKKIQMALQVIIKQETIDADADDD